MTLPLCLIDTREQQPLEPWVLVKGVRAPLPTERRKLDVGDYALDGFEQHVMIERKSVADLYGTLYGRSTDALGEATDNQENLREEFVRARHIPRRYVLVEGGWRDLNAWIERMGRRKTIVDVNALVTSIAIDYGVDFVWCESGRREEAAWFVGFVLTRMWEQATDAREARKARARGLELPWLRKEDENAQE